MVPFSLFWRHRREPRRHLTVVIGLLFAPLMLGMTVLAQTPNLDALRWNSRVLLLFAPSPDHPMLAEQKLLLDRESKALEEREIRVYEITGTSSDAGQLRSKMSVRDNRFAVVLIGKDGGRKLKRDEVVEPSELFNKIDSMPMRRDEMKRAGGK